MIDDRKREFLIRLLSEVSSSLDTIYHIYKEPLIIFPFSPKTFRITCKDNDSKQTEYLHSYTIEINLRFQDFKA